MKKLYGALLVLCGLIFINTEVYSQYCTPSIGSYWGYIKEVKTSGGLVNINKFTGSFSGTGAHRNYTGTDSISTNYGQTFTLTVTRSYGTGVWVDWNDDGDFNDPGEEHMKDASYTSSETTFNLNITVPNTAAYGQLRMRILTGYTWNMRPCGFSSYTGESEDYRIWIPKPINNDAGVTEMNPSTLCSGAQDVNVRVVNFGLDTLKSVTVEGYVGTTTYGPFNLTNIALPRLGDTLLKLGTHTFTAGVSQDIKAWSSNPNGVLDSAEANDTLEIKNFATALSGDYTVGLNLTDDFSSIQDAINTLQNVGVCGPVSILLNDAAPYNERVKIGSIPGVSSTQTVTIKSNPANSDMAVWENTGTSSQNYIVQFSGASYVNIDSVVFKPKSTQYGRIIHFQGGDHHIKITNDSLLGRIGTTTSTFMALVYDETGSNYSEDITFENNYLQGGAYGMYVYGSNTSNLQQRWTIKDNIIVDWYYRGLMLYYGQYYNVSGNHIAEKTTGTKYCCGPAAIYIFYAYNSNIVGNFMCSEGGSSYARTFYAYRTGRRSGTTGRYLIANNMVTNPRPASTSTANYAAYIYDPDYVDILHNSIYCKALSASSAEALYITQGTDMKFTNNIVATDATTGYAAWLGSTYTRTNNCYWAPNATGALNRALTASEFDNADPQFVSDKDLHAEAVAVHDAGDTSFVSIVGDDIDGDVRCPLATCPGNGSAPDIGADEFWLPDYDILPEPLAASPCSGVQDVQVKIKNRGVKTLTSFKVDWWIGTTAQTQLVVSTSSVAAGGDTVVTLGTNNFVNGTIYSFRFATSDPSGQTDQVQDNDTLNQNIQNALSGVFTIGSGGDYPGLDAAAQELATVGMCGPVEFHMLDSTFQENVTFMSISGNSSTNTLTIRSDASNTNQAVLDGGISLGDITHVTIKDIHFQTSGNAIDIDGGTMSTNIVVDSCVFDLGTTQGYAFREATYARNLDSVWFTNNTVNNGYAAFWIYGGSSTQNGPKESNVWVMNNKMNGWYYRGLYLYYVRNVHVENNEIKSGRTYSYPYAIHAWYPNELRIKNNVIQAGGTSGGYGLYSYSANRYSGASDSLILENNFISVGSPNTRFTRYGVYLGWYDYRVKAIHNNISVTGQSSGTTYSFYARYTRNSYFSNNIFENGVGNGTLNQLSNSVVGRDYNGYWNASGNHGSTNGPNTNGVTDNPRYKDPLTADLRVNSIGFDGAGQTGTGVTMDIFGNMRSTTAPDIGAQEFTPCYYDAATTAFYSRYTQVPTGQAIRMYGTVSNVALDSITGVSANATVGANSASLPLGTIESDKSEDFEVLVPLTGAATGVVSGISYATMDSADCDNENDTMRHQFEVTDTVYAYDDSSFTGGIGYTGGIGEFGSVFEIFTQDTITSGSFYLSAPPQGATVRLLVYEFDTAGPGNLIDSTRSFQVGANGAGWYTLQFGCNGIVAQPGSYLVCIDQPNPVNMSLGYNADGRGVEDTRWNRAAGGSWEDMYNNPNSAIATSTLLLRVNLGTVSENDLLPPSTLICNNSSTYIKLNKQYRNQLWSNGLLFDSIQVTQPGTYSVVAWDAIGCQYTDSTVASVATPMNVTTTPTRANCGMSDGSAMASVTGAYAPHTYMWDNGTSGASISNVPGGTYEVTVTDSIGCQNKQTVQVLGAFPDVNTAWTYPTCNGDANGTATANVVTGVAPITYAWNAGGSPNTATNVGLAAGTYTVTVTDAACTKVDTVEVKDAAVLNVNGGVQAPSACKMADGAVTANTTGGLAPYSYLWSNGQTSKKAVGLTKGTYDVTVTDSLGCVAIIKSRVVDPNSPVSIPNNQALDCSYDTTTARVNILGGTAPFQYNWDYQNSTTTTLNGVGSGVYKLHLVDGAGCDHDTTVVITAPPAVNVVFNNLVDGGENKVEVTASTTGGTPPYTWSWDPSGETDSTAKKLVNGVNKVTIIDAKGCAFTYQIDVFSATTGVSYLNNTDVFNIYPNPTTGALNVALNLNSEEDVKVRVLNALGKEIYSTAKENVLQDELRIDLSGQSSGIYFVETTVGAEKIVSKIQLAH